VFLAAVALLLDMPKVFFVFGIMALSFEVMRANSLSSERREQMHQCIKDGGQWVQYSRSGFECVRSER
jgi:uncharacterized membrane protein YesL